MKCWPGWYFIYLAIYLTPIDDNFISIPFIDFAIFSIQRDDPYRVYVAYSRTKSVHTRNIASNAKGKCVFFFWLRQMIALLHTSRGIGGQGKISWCFNERKTEGLARMVTSKNLCVKDKNGAVIGLYVYIFFFVNIESCIIRSKYSSIAINKIWA